MNITRALTSTAAAAALAASLVACSSDGATNATATSEATAADGTATVTSIATATEAAETETATETATDAAGAADAGSVEFTTADGTTTLVPAGLVQAIGQYAAPEWGEALSVEQIDGGWVAAFDNEHYVAWNENTGGAPIWGEIANNWLTQVRAESKVGFPVAAETPLPNESGWTQEFENGTIEWTRSGNDDGSFVANIIEK